MSTQQEYLSRGTPVTTVVADAVITAPCVVCTRPVVIEQDILQGAAAMGVDLTIRHAACGDTPPGKHRTFRVEITTYEVGPDDDLVKMGFIGKTVTAASYAAAVNGDMTTWLEAQWAELQEKSPIADLPTTQGE